MFGHYLTFGVLGVLFDIVAYIPYLRDVLKGRTKPHLFTWIIWTLIASVVFVAQCSSGGEYGAWVTGAIVATCLSIALIALFKGEKNITLFDWICFLGALSGVLVWIFTDEPLYAVIIVTISDVLGFIPTLRKAYSKPHEETAISYALCAVRDVCGLLALQSFIVTNWLYPAVSLIVIDGGFAIMLLVRRRQLRAKN